MLYYIMYNGQVVGPMSKEQIFAYDVTPNSLVSTDGVNWGELFRFPELMDIYTHTRGAGAPGQPDSKKILCGVLAIVVGGLGLQYFLVGKTAGGVINILLSLVTCGLWPIVNVIQGIMILCMSDEEWRRKFVYSTSTFPVF